MERSLRIEKFRNIGFNEPPKKPYERLVLNHSLKKGELGDLVILIGANNSGKSSVLDSLNIITNGNISERDVTDLFMEDKYRKPTITLFCRRDEDNADYFSYKKSFKSRPVYSSSNNKHQELSFKNISLNDIKKDLINLCTIERELYGSSNQNNHQNKQFSNLLQSKETNHEQIINKIIKIINFYKNKDINAYKYFLKNKENIKILKIIDENNTQSLETVNDIHKKQFGYNFIPSIITYEPKNICNNDLISNSKDIKNSVFLMSVLKSINIDVSTIHNTYEMFSKRDNIGVLKQESKKINRKLEEIADKFNQLYHSDNSRYSFEINLEADKIYFSLFREDRAIFLDYQSEGFRWFFNLFFNLLCSNNIQAGDIIIMDEPATNLHVKGQKELRKFLKDFVVHNDITIVLATHSPFLIDLDYLDELRIIKNNDNITSIDNDFTAVNRDDSDSLLAVKEALTIENHIIMNPDKKLIFVEGITDYNYLTAFKILLGKTDFYFLPINGVGTNDDEHKKAISKTLLNIRRDATLLVDGDKAGIAMQKINENSDLNVITLSDIDKKFSGKSIESLFTHDDLEAFGLLNKDGSIIKYNSTSSIFKKKVVNDIQKVSDETLDNFKKLFDTLEEKTN